LNGVALSVKAALVSSDLWESKEGGLFFTETVRFTNLTLKASGTFRCYFKPNVPNLNDGSVNTSVNTTITVLGNYYY